MVSRKTKDSQMNINFDTLNNIPEILALLSSVNEKLDKGTIEKRWLSVNELTNYIPFGKDKIYKMVDVQLKEGTHFYRKENKIVFDKIKIDEWILYTQSNNDIVDSKQLVTDVLSSLAA